MSSIKKNYVFFLHSTFIASFLNRWAKLFTEEDENKQKSAKNMEIFLKFNFRITKFSALQLSKDVVGFLQDV